MVPGAIKANARSAESAVEMVPLPKACRSPWVPFLTWYGLGSGLPQASVTGVSLDPGGFVDLSTFAGWARFDGNRFRVRDARVLGTEVGDRLIGVARAVDGSLWLLAQTGKVLRWKGDAVDRVLASPEPSREPSGFVLDGRGNPWIRLFNGALWQWDGSSWASKVTAWRESRFPCLVSLSSGELVACASDRLEWWSAEGGLTASVTLPVEVTDLVESETGDLLAAAEEGILRVDRRGRLQRYQLHPPPPTQLERLARGGGWLLLQGRGWLGAVKLEQIRKPDSNLKLDWQHHDFRLRSVRTVSGDGAGRFWVGTDGHGLLRVGRPEFAGFCPETLNLPVTGLTRGMEKEFWITFGCHGMVHFSEELQEPFRAFEVRVQGRATCPRGLLLESNQLWVAADRDLVRMRRLPSGDLLPEARLRLESTIGPLLASSVGVWAGTQAGFVVEISPEGKVLQQLKFQPGIRRLVRDRRGQIWVGAMGAVGRIDHQRIVPVLNGEELGGSEVRDLFFHAGEIWIVTYGRGLGRVRGQHLDWIEGAKDLWDVHLSAAFLDRKRRYWLLGNRGAMVFDAATFRGRVPVEQNGLPSLARVGWRLGFPEGNVAEPNGFFDTRQRLYLATISGLVRIDTASFPFGTEPPTVEWTLETSQGRPAEIFGPSVVSRKDGLRLSLAVANLDTLEGNQVEVRIVPGAPAWKPIQDGFTELERLPSGRQVVEVRARAPLGFWSTPRTVAVLEVPSGIWERWDTILGLGVLVLLLGAAGERVRRRLSERRRRELERERLARLEAETRVTRLREDLERVGKLAVVGEASAALTHEVTQPLGTISSILEALKLRLERKLQEASHEETAMLDEAIEHVHRAAAIVRKFRDFLRPGAPAREEQIVVATALEEILPLVEPRVQALSISLVRNIDSDLPPVTGERLALEQVLVNLINNACDALENWHGVRRITVSGWKQERSIRLEIRDSGPGIPRDLLTSIFAPLSSSKPDGLGMGLRIALQNVRQLGGELRVETVGGGAGFVVLLPIGSEGRGR